MLKMEFKDDFEKIKWWEMIFETQIDAKTEEKNGFLSEIKWGAIDF